MARTTSETSPVPERNRLLRLWGASVGRKLVVASSGALLLVFLLEHLYGNLKVFQGPVAVNAYAEWLKGHPMLWVFRAGLFSIFAAHIFVALTLAIQNRRARPQRYVRWQPQASRLPSRTMVWTGILLFGFVIFHLGHFTFHFFDSGALSPSEIAAPVDVYAMVVQAFQNPWIAVIYVVAMVILGFHLLHGTVSAFQTFGIHHESYAVLLRSICFAIVAAIVLGHAAIPILIFFGKVPLPGGTLP